MKLEIEKKFLLKELPIIPYSEIQHIIQYYYLVDDVWYRIRKINSNISEANGTGDVYLHTIKTYKDGNMFPFEEECYYTYDDYKKLLAEIHSGKYDVRYISKTRYIYKTGIMADFEGEEKEIKWEVDSFNFNLIVAELELPSLNFEIEMPEPMKNKLIYEVTGIKQFSNRALAEPLKTVKI